MSVNGAMPEGFPVVKAKPGKKTKRQNLTRDCDLIFSRLVRLPGHCADCGTTQNLQCAHGFSRRYRATRWVFANAWPLCRGCHLKYTLRPLEWEDWMVNHLGHVDYALLRERALKGKNPDLKLLLVELRELEKNAA